jgi:methylenetetrahydrofolate reductase (NADPH)
MNNRPDNPPEPRAPIQLKMNFSGDNPLADALRKGEFLLLVEQDTPLREQPLDSAMALPVAVAKRAAAHPLIAGMAVTDRRRGKDSHDPVDAAALLAEASGKPSLLILSGKASTKERVRDAFARAASQGVRNIVPVTGDRSDKHPAPRSSIGHYPLHPQGYFDSVSALRLIKTSTTGLYAGAGVNPFKYNAADLYLQYYKLLRKLATGAEFVVTHAGWDMKKLQELQWFLQMRDISVPVIARVHLFSSQDIETIDSGLFPGVQANRLFYAMLQRESGLNPAQGVSAQLHRAALQVAGCKLLGYSGVQLSGIRDAAMLDMVMDKVKELLAKYRELPAWIAAWNEFHNFIEFAPFSGGFYAFRNLMTPEWPAYKPECHSPADKSWPKPRGKDRFRAFSLRWLLAPWSPKWLADTARFAACRRCKHAGCGYENCYHLCPKDCPKALTLGACGGTSPDGTCEFGHAPCFFHRVLALAAARGELDKLEEGVKAEG